MATKNQIKTANGPKRSSFPVMVKGHREQLLSDVRIVADDKFPEKYVHALEHNYGKAPYFPKYGRDVCKILQEAHAHLIDLNYEFFKNAFHVETKILKASSQKKLAAKLTCLCICPGKLM